MPELSICIPTYNRVDLLAQTLPTIQNQTYGDFELVIVDNASTDGTEDFVRSLRDSRVRYVRNPENLGLVGNQNRCIEEAAGSIIAIYHDHDIYDPDLVRQSMELLHRHPRVGVVCTGVLLVDPFDTERVISRFIEKWDEVTPGMTMHKRLLYGYPSPITAPTTMVRRACYEKAGLWRLDVGEGADRELWLRIFRDWDLGYIKGPLARLRDRVPRDTFNFAQAKHVWKTLEGQAYITGIHLEETYKLTPVQRQIARLRARALVYKEFWKWAIWAIAKEHHFVSEVGVDAFRYMGMPISAGVLNRLRRSRLAHLSLAQAARFYRMLLV